MRITLSELKGIIKEEVRRARIRENRGILSRDIESMPGMIDSKKFLEELISDRPEGGKWEEFFLAAVADPRAMALDLGREVFESGHGGPSGSDWMEDASALLKKIRSDLDTTTRNIGAGITLGGPRRGVDRLALSLGGGPSTYRRGR